MKTIIRHQQHHPALLATLLTITLIASVAGCGKSHTAAEIETEKASSIPADLPFQVHSANVVSWDSKAQIVLVYTKNDAGQGDDIGNNPGGRRMQDSDFQYLWHHDLSADGKPLDVHVFMSGSPKESFGVVSVNRQAFRIAEGRIIVIDWVDGDWKASQYPVLELPQAMNGDESSYDHEQLRKVLGNFSLGKPLQDRLSLPCIRTEPAD